MSRPDERPLAQPVKRILYVSTHSDRSGAPVHVASLATEAMTQGWAVSIAFGGDGDAFHGLEGAELYPLDRLERSISPLRDVLALLDLASVVRRSRPQLIHAHSAKAALLARLCAAVFRIPMLYTVHGWSFGPRVPRVQSALGYLVEFLSARVLPAVYLFVCRHDAEIGQRRLGLRGPRTHVIPNGVRPPLHCKYFHYRDHLTLLMAARVSGQKDHASLVKTLPRIRGKWRLRLVGPGTDDAVFKQSCLTDGARLEDITFVGCVAEMQQEYLSCDAVALVSNYEGMPLTILEAMSHALPVLASNVGGVSEVIVDGENGLLLPDNDPATIAAALNSLESPAFASKLGHRAHAAYYERFSMDQMLASTFSLYRQVGGG